MVQGGKVLRAYQRQQRAEVTTLVLHQSLIYMEELWIRWHQEHCRQNGAVRNRDSTVCVP